MDSEFFERMSARRALRGEHRRMAREFRQFSGDNFNEYYEKYVNLFVAYERLIKQDSELLTIEKQLLEFQKKTLLNKRFSSVFLFVFLLFSIGLFFYSIDYSFSLFGCFLALLSTYPISKLLNKYL